MLRSFPSSSDKSGSTAAKIRAYRLGRVGFITQTGHGHFRIRCIEVLPYSRWFQSAFPLGRHDHQIASLADNFANNLLERRADQYLNVDMQSLFSERRDGLLQLLSPFVHDQFLQILRRHRGAQYPCMSGQALNNINDGQFARLVFANSTARLSVSIF